MSTNLVIEFFLLDGNCTIWCYSATDLFIVIPIFLEADASGSVSSGGRRPVSVFGGGEPGKKISDGSLPGEPHAERLTNLTPQHFQGGRAEALGALCRCVFPHLTLTNLSLLNW